MLEYASFFLSYIIYVFRENIIILFIVIFYSSLLFGNMYEYFVFNGQSDITDSDRTKLFLVLSAAGGAGISFFPINIDSNSNFLTCFYYWTDP